MKISQVAVQLYTLRDHCQTIADFTASMKKVRSIGYTAVQLSGVGAFPVSEISSILQGEGLICCATHEPGKQILSDPSAIIDRLDALNCSITAYPFPDGIDFSNDASIDALITGLDASGATLRAAGKILCYHNHDNEFARRGKQSILEAIYAQTNPQNLQAELDTFWVQAGGGNPVAWCEMLKGRLPVIHLKDYVMGPNGRTMAEIGSGNIDFASVITAAENSGCLWFVVEQDVCPGDPFDSVRMSYDYIAEYFAD